MLVQRKERLERSCRMRKAIVTYNVECTVFMAALKIIKINRHQENNSSTCSFGEPKVRHCRSMDSDLQSCTQHMSHHDSVEYTSLESKTEKHHIRQKCFYITCSSREAKG